VPAGIAQLGYDVTLLDDAALGTGDLSRFDAIVTGTRAYAVRNDLRTHNPRLLDYVKAGGNMIVLYNTAELVPDKFSPYPAELTQRAEEVSEEDSPSPSLAPDQRVFTWPNRITEADFDQWVEQRGSKFFSKWDTATADDRDLGSRPGASAGGWLQASYGKGHYTYFAYALHRQLPYGVPGAYRLLANLLALGKRREVTGVWGLGSGDIGSRTPKAGHNAGTRLESTTDTTGGQVPGMPRRSPPTPGDWIAHPKHLSNPLMGVHPEARSSPQPLIPWPMTPPERAGRPVVCRLRVT